MGVAVDVGKILCEILRLLGAIEIPSPIEQTIFSVETAIHSGHGLNAKTSIRVTWLFCTGSSTQPTEYARAIGKTLNLLSKSLAVSSGTIFSDTVARQAT